MIIESPGVLLYVPVSAGVIGLLGTAFTGAVVGSIIVGTVIGLLVVLVLAFGEI